MADELPWPELDPIPEGWLDDTPHAAVVGWRRLTPARRVATSGALLRSARRAIAAGVRLREPMLPAADVARRVREAIARGAR